SPPASPCFYAAHRGRGVRLQGHPQGDSAERVRQPSTTRVHRPVDEVIARDAGALVALLRAVRGGRVAVAGRAATRRRVMARSLARMADPAPATMYRRLYGNLVRTWGKLWLLGTFPGRPSNSIPASPWKAMVVRSVLPVFVTICLSDAPT